MTAKMMIGLFGLGAGAVTVGCGYLANKVRKLTKKVGMTMDAMTEADQKEIEKSMIERCVERAAKQEVKRYAQDWSSFCLLSCFW